MPQKPNKALIQVLKKIPIFNGLSPSQIQKVLSLCTTKSLQEKEVLFEKGSASEEMYVLLTGELSVKKADGTSITTIGPVTTVGEIGIITREPRNVTVEAILSSALVRINKSNFELLLHDDLDASVTIFRNMVTLLSKRIDEDNVRRVDFEFQRSQLKRLQEELGIAKELLTENGLSEKEASDSIARKLRETLKKVLIVDDEKSIRVLIGKALQEFNVIEAENGEDALELVKDTLPDLVIADVNMPKMDGMELLSELKNNYPDLPVIGLSGYVDSGQGDNLGFDSFIYKPFQMQLMRQQVKKHMEIQV